MRLYISGFLGWVKKVVEMGRYYGSEALRNPKLQKKAIDYALDKLNPMIQNVGSQALGTAWKLKFRGRFWTFYI